ncbi:unnamed protein product [Heterobilharzia americana]|nr:unnamed protein product [Heterobilharzia americana]
MEEKYPVENNDKVPDNTSPANNKTKRAINLSTKVLSSAEVKVLKKGLSFSVAASELLPDDVIPKVEMALSSVDEAVADEVRAQCAVRLKRQKKTKQNLPKAEKEALKDLQNANDMTITKSSVVLNKSMLRRSRNI